MGGLGRWFWTGAAGVVCFEGVCLFGLGDCYGICLVILMWRVVLGYLCCTFHVMDLGGSGRCVFDIGVSLIEFPVRLLVDMLFWVAFVGSLGILAAICRFAGVLFEYGFWRDEFAYMIHMVGCMLYVLRDFGVEVVMVSEYLLWHALCQGF
eukprot:gene13206-9052_t